ncbi:PREDICTED: spidroin-1-like isoform X3 [Poecilia mexicana]|uniref:spidroin-1-like isoform X3 n=1 Tax=Poecilia mexicana TaxID=48701 RepID=UPI00072E15B7|nr:PREDICTED: spidroin-1-like isoform X3 [Poecilia mexicana]
MAGQLVLQGVLVLYLVQAAHTGGNAPHNGGRAASFLIPSKDYGAGMNKGVGINGYGAKAGPANLQKMKGFGAQAGGYGRQPSKGNGNGAAAASQSGFGSKGNGYGVISGPTTLQQIKGYEAPAGRYLGQATKGYGYGAHAAAYGGQGDKGNGYGAQAGGYGGQGTKDNGQRLVAGASSSNGARPNGQAHGGNHLKGYGRPHYSPAVGTGQIRGPHPARDQGNVYGGNGYRTHPTKGFSGGYGGAGLGLGSLYGNGVKGPMKGYSASAGVSNGQGSQSNGRAGVRSPNGFGNSRTGAAKAAKPGYGSTTGAALGPQLGYSNGATPNGFGSNHKGYGAVKGFGPQMNGLGVGRVAALGGYEHQPEGFGSVTGKGQSVRGAASSGGNGLKGRVLPTQQQAAASSPTAGVHYLGPNEKYQNLASPASQDKAYKQNQLHLGSGPESAPAAHRYPEPQHGLQPATLRQKGTKYEAEPESVLSPENGRIQGAKAAKPGCGPTGQWMKRLKSGNGGDAKANRPGGFNFPGLSNGHGAGLAYPYGGSIAQPGYGRGVYPAAGYGNLYGALGQVLPAAEQSGGTTQVSFGEAPAGIDGISQLEAQHAGLLPNGAPPGGQTLGLTVEKSNSKYGVGGLQFGEPVHLGTNGAGNYGYGVNPHLPAGDAKEMGKYGYGGVLNGGQLLGLGNNGNIPGYGTLPYEAQPAGFTPEAISAGQYGLIGSPYHPAPSGFGYNGKSSAKYGGGETPYAPQTLGFGEAKSGKYAGKHEAQQTQPLESAAGENAGYLKGQVKPNAVAFPTPSPSPEDSPDFVDSFTPDEGVQDLSDGTAAFLDSSPVAETRGEAHLSENPDDLKLPRQIQIQQQLKLHFHPQGGKKYDLNGFFGNSDHQD